MGIEKLGPDGAALLGGASAEVLKQAANAVGAPTVANAIGGVAAMASKTVIGGAVNAGGAIAAGAIAAAPFLAAVAVGAGVGIGIGALFNWLSED